MAEQETGIGISVRNLYKIFGANPDAYIDAVKGGMTKAELNEKHNHVLGLKDINIDMPGGGIQDNLFDKARVAGIAILDHRRR